MHPEAQAAEAQSREYAAARAATAATVIDVEDAVVDPAAGPREGPPPLRSLEQLVKELDELERHRGSEWMAQGATPLGALETFENTSMS